jgi:2-polyprenyl-6-methoxyphenol hydroxylase-like FAD-dependent oxidoreductase
LSGLCAALALAADGAEVVVLERDPELGAGGAGLGVDRSLLGRVTDASPFDDDAVPALAVITSNRDSTAWMLIYQWLRNLIVHRPRITLHHGAEVTKVGADADIATVATSVGPFAADVVIGADGYRSVVRRSVAPAQPNASFAGYMLWRGLVEEAELPAQTQLTRRAPNVRVEWEGAYRLVAYYVPGADGSTEPGQRRISWAWYDPFQGELLRQAGAVEGGTVRHSIVPAAIPADVAKTLPGGSAHRALLRNSNRGVRADPARGGARGACRRRRSRIEPHDRQWLPLRVAGCAFAQASPRRDRQQPDDRSGADAV